MKPGLTQTQAAGDVGNAAPCSDAVKFPTSNTGTGFPLFAFLHCSHGFRSTLGRIFKTLQLRTYPTVLNCRRSHSDIIVDL